MRMRLGDGVRSSCPTSPMASVNVQVQVVPGGSQPQLASPYVELPGARGHEVGPTVSRLYISAPTQPTVMQSHSDVATTTHRLTWRGRTMLIRRV